MVVSDQNQQPDQECDRLEGAEPRAPVVWTSTEILRGEKEIQIVHRHETYRLRLTRNGKLILCK